MARVIRQVVLLLNRLIQLDYEAIETCKAAAAQLGDAADRARMGTLVRDHREHVEQLALVVRNLGGEPAAYGDLRETTARERIVLGPEAGDAAILETVMANEELVGSAYDEVASQPGVPVDVLASLQQAIDEGRSHRAWLDGRVGPPSSRPA